MGSYKSPFFTGQIFCQKPLHNCKNLIVKNVIGPFKGPKIVFNLC